MALFLDEVSHALAVFAHPDDAEFMFGGTIARLTAKGADVNYVICTDGANGGTDLASTGAELAATRAAELRAAADVLGVGEIASLGYPNDELQVNDDLKRDIIRAIRRFRPQILLTMAPQRLPGAPLDFQHGDHLAASEATFTAAYPQSYKSADLPRTPRRRPGTAPGHRNRDDGIRGGGPLRRRIRSHRYEDGRHLVPS